jgi:integrase
MGRSSFGQITKLPSGRYRARYTVPGKHQRWINAPETFSRKADAETWLARQRADIVDGVVRPQTVASRETLRAYAERWLATRRNIRGEPLRPTTVRGYRHYLDHGILPNFGDLALPKIDRKMVERWYADLLPDRPTSRARTYSLLRTILGGAADEGLIPINPCKIRGAGGSRPAVKPQTATKAQVVALASQMPERLSLAILLGAWCQVRSGEVLELRRKDVTPGRVTVTRGVTWAQGKAHVGPPKTDAGVRVISVPPHIRGTVEEHLARWANPGPDGLLFPARQGDDEHLHQQTFSYHVKESVKRAGLPMEFRFHWLRHTGLTFAARAGATLGELQARAGHSTPGIAMRYQHADAQRDEDLAQALSTLSEE